MSRARDNLQSKRSRAEIDHDDEARRQVQELRMELLYTVDAERFRTVMDRMADWALDPKTPIKTAVVAGAAYTQRVTALVQQTPQVTINQGLRLDAAAILQELSAAGVDTTTGGSPALSTPSDPAAIPTGNLQDAHRLSQPVQQEALPALSPAPEPAADTGARVWSADASEATPPALASREAVRAVGDPTGRCLLCHARTDDEPHACPVQPEV